MTDKEYRSNCKDLIYLASCMVNDRTPDPERAASMQLPALLETAARHQLTGIAACALEAAGIKDPAFMEAKARAVRKAVLFDTERTAVLQELKAQKIWHMPLKGCVLQQYYPGIGMRQMADNDILCDSSRSEDVRRIMEQRGFITRHFGTGVHDVYFKPPVLNFEMHTALFGSAHEGSLDRYYKDVENRLVGDGYEKSFTPEDFYVYITAHEYKHYTQGGTGLRSLLDIYVCLKEMKPDLRIAAEEAEKLGIGEFERKNRILALALFGADDPRRKKEAYSGDQIKQAEQAEHNGQKERDDPKIQPDQEMLSYILSSGTYGTMDHRVGNKMQKNGWSRLQYVLHRFFVPVRKSHKDYTAFSKRYPLFYQCKILLPLLPFIRAMRAMRTGRLGRELRALLHTGR